MKICEFYDFSLLPKKMKKRRKPLTLLGFPAEFLAFPRGFEPPTYRLGGGRSILLSYGNILLKKTPNLVSFLVTRTGIEPVLPP